MQLCGSLPANKRNGRGPSRRRTAAVLFFHDGSMSAASPWSAAARGQRVDPLGCPLAAVLPMLTLYFQSNLLNLPCPVGPAPYFRLDGTLLRRGLKGEVVASHKGGFWVVG